MPRIALTGGIAAGKSVAAARFAELGAVVIDYDVLAREAVAPESPGLAAVVERFGVGVLHPDGTLNRPALGALIFRDDAARENLEGIVHPEVYRLAAGRDAEAVRADGKAVILHDIPLLTETFTDASQAFAFDHIVVVSTPDDVRLHRLMKSRGIPASTARAQIAAQAPEADRLALADVVLDGSRSPNNLRAQVDDLLARLVHPSARLGEAQEWPYGSDR